MSTPRGYVRVNGHDIPRAHLGNHRPSVPVCDEEGDRAVAWALTGQFLFVCGLAWVVSLFIR